MFIVGILMCVAAVFILHKRASCILFGRKASGRITGYCNKTRGLKGFDSYNYRVEYAYNGSKYSAVSLESVQVSRNNIPSKNICADVTVCFHQERPDVVTIYDFKDTSILGGLMFFAGVLLIVIAFVV